MASLFKLYNFNLIKQTLKEADDTVYTQQVKDLIKIARLEGAIEALQPYSSATNIQREIELLRKELEDLLKRLEN